MRIRNSTTILLMFIFIITFQFCYSQDSDNYTITPSEPSYISDNHTFLSYLTKLKTGRILHVFRLDPGLMGNHVGNGGSIVKRFSDDDGKTWSNPVTIFKDSIDDRVSSGGVLDDGTIVIFFGRYKTIGLWDGNYVDYNLISSKDNGETWSKIVTLPSVHGLQSGIFKIKSKEGYFTTTYEHYYADIRYSPDGYNWDSVYSKWDYTKTKQFDLYEPTIASIEDGRLVTLFRQENNPLYQSISSDYGKTWTVPDTTSIANNYYCIAPLNLYDSKLNKLITIATDRRGGNYSNLNNDAGLWVYCNNPDSVFENLKGYNNPQFRVRSEPNTFRLLGYPSATKLNDSTYLVVYSDDYKKTNSLEDADFFQFNIIIDTNTYTSHLSQNIIFDSIATLSYDTPIYKLSAKASSMLPVSFISSDTLIAKIENGNIKVIGVGTCTISALQNGNYKYYPAKTEIQKITVEKASQIISFNALPILKFDSPSYNLSAHTNSMLPLTYISSDTSIAKVKNGTITIVSTGTCIITALQSGDNNYNGGSYPQSLTINKADQSITFKPIPEQMSMSDSVPLLEAISSSRLPVSFGSSDTNIIRIVNGKMIITGIGKCTISAYQKGNNNFVAAPLITQPIEVEKTTIAEMQKPNIVEAYPNPTQGKITVSNIEGARVEIISISGNVIQTDNSIENERVYDLSNYSSGLYLIKIITKDSRVETHRIMMGSSL
jgi:hypothetical protein